MLEGKEVGEKHSANLIFFFFQSSSLTSLTLEFNCGFIPTSEVKNLPAMQETGV